MRTRLHLRCYLQIRCGQLTGLKCTNGLREKGIAHGAFLTFSERVHSAPSRRAALGRDCARRITPPSEPGWDAHGALHTTRTLEPNPRGTHLAPKASLDACASGDFFSHGWNFTNLSHCHYIAAHSTPSSSHRIALNLHTWLGMRTAHSTPVQWKRERGSRHA